MEKLKAEALRLIESGDTRDVALVKIGRSLGTWEYWRANDPVFAQRATAAIANPGRRQHRARRLAVMARDAEEDTELEVEPPAEKAPPKSPLHLCSVCHEDTLLENGGRLRCLNPRCGVILPVPGIESDVPRQLSQQPARRPITSLRPSRSQTAWRRERFGA
jgi:hypothetical protein